MCKNPGGCLIYSTRLRVHNAAIAQADKAASKAKIEHRFQVSSTTDYWTRAKSWKPKPSFRRRYSTGKISCRKGRTYWGSTGI